jgi:four helix bundle protein
MKEEKSFKKLMVWQKAYVLVRMIYLHSYKFPSTELYGLTSQIRRAGVSVLANIAEGSERQHKKEFLQFLSVARGSLAEVETYLMLARDLHYLDEEEFCNLEEQRGEVGKLLRGLDRSLS